MFQVMPTVEPRPPDPGSPVQFCYDDKEKILVVGYDDGTVVTFKDDVKILSQKYTPHHILTIDHFSIKSIHFSFLKDIFPKIFQSNLFWKEIQSYIFTLNSGLIKNRL